MTSNGQTATALAAILLGWAACAVAVESPFGMARSLEARMAAGDGVTLPDANVELVRHAGIANLAEGDWPEAFLARAGGTICVAVSPFTGCYEFFDETGTVFWTVVPVLPTTENWVAPFRHTEEGTFPDDDFYAPWRLVDVWFLSHAESAESSGRDAPTARPPDADGSWSCPYQLDLGFLDNGGQLRFVNNPDPTNLCFTAFSFTETNLFFSAAWPTNEALPESILDLYGSTNLSSRWLFLSSHPATNSPIEFTVSHTLLPWYVEPTQHVHDATCVSVTNIVASPLDGTTVYTNTFWSCSTNCAPGEVGFFRLGTHHDTDGDGLFDAAELLVFGTRSDRLDTDGDGVPDSVEPSVWWSHPLWATNAEDVDFIVDIVAPTDGSAETVLTMDGLRIPLSPAAGSWCFSLPPGQIVSCSATSSGSFFVLWASTPGGSFWDSPESFETPFWTAGNIAGYHESGASSDIAVPALSVEPDFGGGLRSGGSSNGNHVAPDGSLCVHAADGIQRYFWTVAPAIAAVGRTPVTTGAVQLESGNPFIDVSSASGVLSGAFGFGPGWAPGGGIIWGWITNFLSAHRCDATPASPHCSVCGCYQPLDAFLAVSNTVLTLKHDNQTQIEIAHPYSWGESFEEGTVEIRRAGGNNEWMALGTESELNPWTARIAGHFELRGISSVDGNAFTTAVQQIEVRFPCYDDIVSCSNVIRFCKAAWIQTLLDTSPTNRRERGFWVWLDTGQDEYEPGLLELGDFVENDEGSFIDLSSRPGDMPALPPANASSARYPVASFHTHTPTYYRTSGRGVGPSPDDNGMDIDDQVPGIVYDYLGNGLYISAGHPIVAPAGLWKSLGLERRPTP